MIKTFFKMFFCLVLFLNCNNQTDTNQKAKESSENIDGKVEAVSVQLYNKALLFFENGQFEESKKELLILRHKFPNSMEIVKSNKLLDSIELELENIREQNELNKIKERNREKEFFEKATKHLIKTTDKLEGISWYRDKSSPRYINKNGFYLYLSSSLGYGTPSLRLKIQFKDDEWLFIKEYQVFVDGLKFSIQPEYGEIKRDNGYDGVWEWLDIWVDENEFEMLNAIKNGKDIKIRYISDNYHRDRALTLTEKEAIINILNVYSKLGGKLN